MIGKKLQEILDEKKMNVNELSRGIGVSNQTLYSIIKRDNMKIDFDILLKICKYMGVNIERFYQDYLSADLSRTSLTLTSHETQVVHAYRSKPDMQPAVDKLLGISEEPQAQKPHRIRLVASDGNTRTLEMTQEQYDAAEAALDKADAKSHGW